MTDLFNKLIQDTINNSGIVLKGGLNGLCEQVFYIEKYMGDATGGTLFTQLRLIFYSLAIWLLILKFTKKGFETYILGTEGDADAEPIALLTRFLKAMVLMICFPLLYEYLARITMGISSVILDNITGSVDDYLNGANLGETLGTLGLGIIGLVGAFIGIVILYFQILMRGCEMFIMRIGFCFACVGIMESDNGAFAPYMMTFFKCAFTTIIQIALLQLSVTLIATTDVMIGFAFLFLAIGTPKFLQQFMVPSGGGGGVFNKAYQGVRLADMAMRLKG